VQCDWESLKVTYSRSLIDLAALRFQPSSAKGQSLPAAGLPWFMTVFGRDSIITSLQALPFAPELARATLLALAHRQGTRSDDFREEDPGKIMHELRRLDLIGAVRSRFELVDVAHTDQGVSGRDQRAVLKTASGLLKLLYPNGEVSDEALEEVLSLACESRQRVRDQLHLMAPGEYDRVRLGVEMSPSGKQVSPVMPESGRVQRVTVRQKPAVGEVCARIVKLVTGTSLNPPPFGPAFERAKEPDRFAELSLRQPALIGLTLFSPANDASCDKASREDVADAFWTGQIEVAHALRALMVGSAIRAWRLTPGVVATARMPLAATAEAISSRVALTNTPTVSTASGMAAMIGRAAAGAI